MRRRARIPRWLLLCFCSSVAAVVLWRAGSPPPGTFGSEAPKPTSVEELKILLSEKRQIQIMAGWDSAMNSGDLSIVTAALADLGFAPPPLKSRIATKMKDSPVLPTLFESLGLQQRDELVKAVSPYPEIAAALQGAIAKQLKSLKLSPDNFQYVSDAMGILTNDTPLSEELKNELMRGVAGADDPQVVQSIAAVVRRHAGEFRARETEIRTWVKSKSTDKSRLALHLLFVWRATLPPETVDEALRDPAGGLQDDAIAYLGGIPGEVSKENLQFLFGTLNTPSSGFTWERSYRTLAGKRPDLLNEYFHEPERGFRDWAKLRSDITVQILQVLPLDRDRDLAAWPLIEGSRPDSSPCATVRSNLLLLQRRARSGMDVNDGLWKVLQAPESCNLGDDAEVPDLIEKALTAGQGNVESFSRFLVTRSDTKDWENFIRGVELQTGYASVFEPGGRGASALHRALSPVLVKGLRAERMEKAVELLRLGVPADTGAPWSAAFYANFLDKRRLSDETVLEVLGRLGRAPGKLCDLIEEIAADTGQKPTVRREAIKALMRLDSREKYFDAFIRIAQEQFGLASWAALDALIEVYRTSRTAQPALDPSALWLSSLSKKEATRPDAQRLFTLLAKRDRAFGDLLFQALGDGVASYRCWDLSVVDPLPSNVWLGMFEVGLTDPSSRLAGARACVMLLTSDQPQAGTMSAALTGTRSQNLPSSSNDRIALLNAFSVVWPETSALPRVQQAIANQIDLLAPSLPYTVASQAQLKEWSARLKTVSPPQAQQIDGELSRRRILLALLGIPVFVVVHFLLWMVLLFLYPYSPAVQSVIFWNPLVRKIVAFGYMDAVLLSFGFARRRLFAPFREQMFGEILQPGTGELDRLSYFDKGRVKRTAASRNALDEIKEEPIVVALGMLKRRTLLLGASGLGKSSFLRYSLRQKAESKSATCMYLPALRCSPGVEEAIAARVPLFSQDRDLLRSLIHAGRIEVYIDGYNEVDLATQEAITSFTAMFTYARILVTSQIPLRGLSLIETLELQPLRREEIAEFLVGRGGTLPKTAVIRGEEYKKIAEMYLKNLWEEVLNPAETQAYEMVLSNPMDLTTTAIVLGNGKEPNLLSLQEQQFQLMLERHMLEHGTAFRTAEFSDDIFERRVAGDDDLTQSSFDREIGSLIAEKMALVRTVEVRGRAAKQEIRFRHDRIRDYISHFAFIGEDRDERRFLYARDSRFLGVYEYLAKVLPLGSAERLREFLLMRAVESQDHRVSDSFIRQMSWRQQFASDDPLWLSDFDLPDAREADLEFDALQSDRVELEARMLALRGKMTDVRQRTRVLTAYEDDQLLDLGLKCLLDRGALQVSSAPSPGLGGVVLRSPEGCEFTFAAIGSRTRIDPFQIELLHRRAKALPRPILLLTNSQVTMRPTERLDDIEPEKRGQLLKEGIVPFTAGELYELYKVSADMHERLWTGVHSKWLAKKPNLSERQRSD
jgi:hypothetical protein